MKKIIIILAGVAIFAVNLSFRNIAAEGYSITGSISGLDSGRVYLTHTYKNITLTDSTEVNQGSFSFKGKTPEPLFYILKIPSIKRQFGFFVENNPMTIQAGQNFTDIKITGSKSQVEFEEWSKAWKQITAKAGTIYKKIDEATKNKDEAAGKAARLELEGLSDETDKAVDAFIHAHPNSPVGPFVIMDRYINYPAPQKVVKYFAMLGAPAKSSSYGTDVQKAMDLSSRTAVGSSPDFALADTSGKSIRLSALKGKYVLVDFWASWCVPCRKENPNVVKAFRQFHDKGFEIVGVSLDTKKDSWLAAINKDGLTWNHVSDLKGWESPVVTSYGIKSIPTNFLLDKSGKVIARDLRGEDLDKQLEKIFQ